MSKNSHCVSHIFEYETKRVLNPITEEYLQLRVDCSVFVNKAENYPGQKPMYYVDKLDVHEIQVMSETSEDMTFLKQDPEIMSEISQQIEKDEDYIISKVQ